MLNFFFSLLILGKTADFSSCFSFYNTLTDLFLCWANTLKPVPTEMKSQFMQCLNRCYENPNQNNSYCGGYCAMQEKCSSDECEECINSCSQISEPLHSQQCYSGCYRHKRINPYVDYGPRATTDCESFQMFYTEILVKYTDIKEADLRTSIETMCSENIKALPICYAIAKKTWATSYENLNNQPSAEQFCSAMGFSYD